MALNKYRLITPVTSHMLSDERLTFQEAGVLGWLSTQINRDGHRIVTALNVPRREFTSHEQVIAVLDRLVETEWAEVVE